ncbi:MAG: preprotein translocase subunit YajC [Bacteroidales bacterium]|nr:preprotein translocase subunit YajC [Candidatus Equimonas enterica]
MLTLLQAQAQGGGLSMIIMLVAIFAIMYFFMIRPQNKQRKKLQQFRDSLTVGQEVVTIGGLHGTVKNIDGQSVKINIATGVDVIFEKSAIVPQGTTPEQR